MWKYIGQGNKRDVQGGEWQRHSKQKEQYFEMDNLFGD